MRYPLICLSFTLVSYSPHPFLVLLPSSPTNTVLPVVRGNKDVEYSVLSSKRMQTSSATGFFFLREEEFVTFYNCACKKIQH